MVVPHPRHEAPSHWFLTTRRMTGSTSACSYPCINLASMKTAPSSMVRVQHLQHPEWDTRPMEITSLAHIAIAITVRSGLPSMTELWLKNVPFGRLRIGKIYRSWFDVPWLGYHWVSPSSRNFLPQGVCKIMWIESCNALMHEGGLPCSKVFQYPRNEKLLKSLNYTLIRSALV